MLSSMPHLAPALAPGAVLMPTFMDALFCQVGAGEWGLGWAGSEVQAVDREEGECRVGRAVGCGVVSAERANEGL